MFVVDGDGPEVLGLVLGHGEGDEDVLAQKGCSLTALAALAIIVDIFSTHSGRMIPWILGASFEG